MTVLMMDSLAWPGNSKQFIDSYINWSRYILEGTGILGSLQTLTFKNATPPRPGMWYAEMSSLEALFYRLPRVATDETLIVGGHINWERETADDQLLYSLVQTEDTDDHQCFLRINKNTHTVSVVRGTTVLGTTTETLPDLEWLHVEWNIKVTNSTAAGECELFFDGVSVLDLVGVDTQNQATDTVEYIRVAGGIGAMHLRASQFYVLDELGTFANSPLGKNARIDVLYPDDNGTYNDYTGSDADQVDNFEMVNQVNADDTTEYIGSSVAGEKDSHNVEDIKGVIDSPGIMAVQVVGQYVKFDDPEPRAVKQILRHLAVDHFGAGHSLSVDTYQTIFDLHPEDPSDSTQWTLADVNALQVGCETI
jgi:hypothetical protein